MVHWLSFVLFIFAIFLHKGGWVLPPEKSSAFRVPASQAAGCYESFSEFQVITDEKSRYSFWKRLVGLPEKRFDHDHYRQLVEKYSQREGEALFMDVEKSSESVMAMVRVLGQKYNPEGVKDLKLNIFKEGSLERTVRRLSEKGRLESAQIDDLTRDLYLTAFGPEIKVKNLLRGKKAQEEALLRVVEQDLLSRGLIRVFKDYRYSQAHPTFIQKFRRSRYGRGALTGLLNLPVYIGWPPLYLPGLKPIRLSEELASQILEQGLTEPIYRRLQMELGATVLNPLRYEIIKSYYLKGIMVYVTLAGFYDFYQLNKELDDEQQIIQEATDEAVRILNIAEDLEQNGIDIFADEAVKEGQSFCDAIYSCLETLGVSGDKASEHPDEVATCRSLMDPDNRCKTL